MMRNLLELNHFILECRASDAKQMERDKKEIGELADLLRGGVKQSDAQMQLIRELGHGLREGVKQSDEQMQVIKDMDKTMDKLMERKNKLKEADQKKVEEANNRIETLEKQIQYYRVGAQKDHRTIQWWLRTHHGMEKEMEELRGKLEMSEKKAEKLEDAFRSISHCISKVESMR